MFSCEFCQISKNTFFQNTSGRLLLPLAFVKIESKNIYKPSLLKNNPLSPLIMRHLQDNNNNCISCMTMIFLKMIGDQGSFLITRINLKDQKKSNETYRVTSKKKRTIKPCLEIVFFSLSSTLELASCQENEKLSHGYSIKAFSYT